MGRRALRKIDPALDLSRHLFKLEDLQTPLRLESMFARVAPLEIEIGSGKGLFMATASDAIPDHNFLGIEITGKYARFAAAKLARDNRDNAVMIHGDAQRFCREFVADASVAAVHVYFPDPWWKKRHRKRRIMNESFLREVVRILKTGGKLHFWTDVQEYFDTSLDLIQQVPELDGPIDVNESQAEHDLDYRTHFERRMRLNDEPVYRAEFRRTSDD